ncbi:MAG: hypothetical protein HQK96_03820 [Nitrospirae bacterium]|nr:hypothetical protein [Nitrospirota bacterium]
MAKQMTMEDFENKQAQMSNEELIELVNKQIIELARTGGKSHRMCIPPSIKDTDMLLSELVKRFKVAISSPQPTREIDWKNVESELPKHIEGEAIQVIASYFSTVTTKLHSIIAIFYNGIFYHAETWSEEGVEGDEILNVHHWCYLPEFQSLQPSQEPDAGKTVKKECGTCRNEKKPTTYRRCSTCWNGKFFTNWQPKPSSELTKEPISGHLPVYDEKGKLIENDMLAGAEAIRQMLNKIKNEEDHLPDAGKEERSCDTCLYTCKKLIENCDLWQPKPAGKERENGN